jgi:uncharacterized protein
MIVRHGLGAALAAMMVFVSSPGDALGRRQDMAAQAGGEAAAIKPRMPLVVRSASGVHRFEVEVASTPAEQQRGLMYRTNIAPDGGMLFFPYPADGSGPREASFWMKNTPSALDLLFIRTDGTIARIGANAVPFSEESVRSGEPVAAVLEIPGGRAAALGIAAGDTVSWPGQAQLQGR